MTIAKLPSRPYKNWSPRLIQGGHTLSDSPLGRSMLSALHASNRHKTRKKSIKIIVTGNAIICILSLIETKILIFDNFEVLRAIQSVKRRFFGSPSLLVIQFSHNSLSLRLFWSDERNTFLRKKKSGLGVIPTPSIGRSAKLPRAPSRLALPQPTRSQEGFNTRTSAGQQRRPHHVNLN